MSTYVKRGFQCCAAWHLWRHGLALGIYDKLGSLTYNKELTKATGQMYLEYTSTVERLADYFGCHKDSAYAAVKFLKTNRWLRVVGTGPAPVKFDKNGQQRKIRERPKDYLYIAHDEWAVNNPGRCYVAQDDVMVWDGDEHDVLAQTLFKISGHKVRWYTNTLTALRSTGKDDNAIAAAWFTFWRGLDPRPTKEAQYQAARFAFIRQIKGEVTEEPSDWFEEITEESTGVR